MLRIELPPNGKEYVGFKLPEFRNSSKIQWNPSRTLILATFAEDAIIMSPAYYIVKWYRNTESVRWKSDNEIIASVETGIPGVYSRQNFVINIDKDTANVIIESKSKK